jgi:hypothetical protein
MVRTAGLCRGRWCGTYAWRYRPHNVNPPNKPLLAPRWRACCDRRGGLGECLTSTEANRLSPRSARARLRAREYPAAPRRGRSSAISRCMAWQAFAFGYWFQTNGAPDASDIAVRGNRTPTLRPSLAIGAACVFAATFNASDPLQFSDFPLQNGHVLAQLACNARAQPWRSQAFRQRSFTRLRISRLSAISWSRSCVVILPWCAAAIASSSTTMHSAVFLADLSRCINSSKVIAAFTGTREAFYRPVGDYHRANAKIVIQLD